MRPRSLPAGQQLPGITRAILHLAERKMRHEALQHHALQYQQREAHQRELERERAEAERIRLAAIEVRRRLVRDGIVALAQDARAAQMIRAMVSDIVQHPDVQHGRPAAFDAWRTEALYLADALDPMRRPLSELVGGIEPRAP